MTLLIAAVAEQQVWMIADAAIIGGELGVRQREFALKILPSRDERALVGFAGDHHHGTRLVNAAAALATGPGAVDYLLRGQQEYPSVSFAYAYIDAAGPHLYRIADGEALELTTFHLGVTDAFDHFQRVRHDNEIDPTPRAVRTFITGSTASSSLPDGLSIAITSMLRVFAERQERDVGGWVTPYFVTSSGTFFCGYGYAVSDPILTKIGPGSLVPHGTAEAGGFGLSVTQIGNKEGVAVYWLQQPGGLIFSRTDDGYKVSTVEGRPSQFIERASAETGRKIDLFFSDDPHGPPESITIMRDQNGVPSMAIAVSGKAFSVSVLNVANPFTSQAAIDFTGQTELISRPVLTEHFRVTLSEDRNAVSVALLSDMENPVGVSATANELDALISGLGEKRWMLREYVPDNHAHAIASGSMRRELMVVNPGWRTELPIHPALNGITLRLRHPGFGWLTFLLPWREARALGEWLVKNSPPQPGTAAQ